MVTKPDNEIEQAHRELLSVHDEEALSLFVNMLFDLPTYLVRINEEVTILNESPTLKITSRQLYRIGPRSIESDGHSGSGTVLVPVARPKKGRLFDYFEIRTSEGRAVHTLPHNHVRGLLAWALEAYARTCPAEGGQIESDEIVAALISAIWMPRDSAQSDEATKIFARLEDLSEESKAWCRRLRELYQELMDTYVIVAEVPRSEGAFVKVEYSYEVPDDGVAHHRNRLRSRFGLSTSTMDIPLHLYAFDVQSYHFQVSAEPGQYIFDHYLEHLESQSKVTTAELRSGRIKPYVRIYEGESRSNAHLYIRRQVAETRASHAQGDDAQAGAGLRLKSVIRFREIPPGALGAVTVMSLASTALISFFAVTGIQADAPAFLLALTAFTGVLIGAWLDHSRLRRTSLTVYLALALVMMLTIASALYHIVSTGPTGDEDGEEGSGAATEAAGSGVLPFDVPVLTIRHDSGFGFDVDLIWATLMLASISLSLFLMRSLIVESKHYFGGVERRIVDGAERRKEDTEAGDARATGRETGDGPSGTSGDREDEGDAGLERDVEGATPQRWQA